jgi:hypothetical protein
MSKSIDKLLREKLSETEYNIPESFDMKLNETINKIENYEIRKRSKHVSWLSANKVAGVAILFFMLSVISISSYAAVNLFQERMNAVPEKAREKYNNDVQKSIAEVDVYSRKLTDSEEERMIYLRGQYQKEGKFPEKEIKQITNNENMAESELYFVAEESKFYLPDRNLSEEEMLEIIDLQEKRDYSVQQQNVASDKSDKNVKSNVKLENQSIEVVTKLYNLNEKNLKIVSTDLVDDCYVYVIKGDNVSYSVYYSKEEEVERVILKKDNLPAHQSGKKLKTLNIKLVSEILKKKAEVLSGKKVDSYSIYSLIDDKENLASGTVSYYYQMADGSGCVAVYSIVYQDMYDIYLINNSTMLQEIEEKIKKAKGSGYTYQLIQ